ncbi:MAG: ABC transporter substrate-binding protein [Deltaproteobacteria bacterium]|nr:ABC transporter substrate-binding protein [Deltaproteobacteria bacterium]
MFFQPMAFTAALIAYRKMGIEILSTTAKIFIGFVLIFTSVDKSHSQAERPLRVAWSSIASSQAILWVAHEGGLFKKHGLQVELVYIPSGPLIIQSMLAKEIEVAQTAGPAVVAADLSGANLVIVAGINNTFVYSFRARSEIRTPGDLKGKKIGVTRIGSDSHTATVFALRKWGLEPERDVTILQLGGQPEILAALQAGLIDAAPLSYPQAGRARQVGISELADIGGLGIAYQGTAIIMRRDQIEANRERQIRFLKGIVEGIYVYLHREEFAMGVIGKYSRIKDRELLSETYRINAQRYLEKIPYPTLPGIQNILNHLALKNPKARQARPEQFVDRSMIAELEQSGFVKQVSAGGK